MSYALDQEDDQPESQVNEKDPSEAISLGGGGSGTASPGGGNVGGPGQAAQTAAAKPSSSGSWTNLQSYLDANSGQGDQVGSQIAGSVNQQGQTAQNDINNASSDFTNNVNANTVQQDSTGVAKDISDATSAKAGSTQDPNDVSNFQSQANASYNGPTDFTQDQYYGQAQQDANTATQAADETGSEAGREVLLGNQYNNASQSGYNQGEQNLDQLLLENSSGAQAALSPLASQWGGLNTALGNAATSGDAAAAAGVKTDQATSQAAQAALTSANTGFQSGLTNQVAAINTSDAGVYAQMQKDLISGNLTADEAKAVGVTGPESLYGIDPTKYLSQGAPVTLANDASADQYAQAAALAQLSGQPGTFLNQADIGQAGTASPAYTFDATNPNGFQAALSQAKDSFNEQNNQLSNELATLQKQLAAAQFGGADGHSQASGQDPAAIRAAITKAQVAQKALVAQFNPTQQWGAIQAAIQ